MLSTKPRFALARAGGKPPIAGKPVDDEVSVASAELATVLAQQAAAIAPVKFDDSVVAGFRKGCRQHATTTAEKTLTAGKLATEKILQMAGWIQEMRSQLSRLEFGAFVKGLLQWVGEEARKYLDIARAFEGFDLSRLLSLEPFTILKLRSKRYLPVVERLREQSVITSKLVQDLIRELLPKQSRKQSDSAISGWKQCRSGGGRYYQVQLHDEQTGLMIEQQAEAEGILPQKVIEKAIALRAQQKSSVQPNEYRAAQLEELQTVVENARSLDTQNRKLAIELQKRDLQIADLEAKLAESIVAASVEPDGVQKDEVTVASIELNEYLEEQVSAIAPEYISEYSSETTEATDYSDPEQKSEYLEPAEEDILLEADEVSDRDREESIATEFQKGMKAQRDFQVFQVGDRLEYGTPEETATATSSLCKVIDDRETAIADIFDRGWETSPQHLVEDHADFIDDINQEVRARRSCHASERGKQTRGAREA